MFKFLKNFSSHIVFGVITVILFSPFFVYSGDVGGPGQPAPQTTKIDIINPFKCPPNGGADNKCSIPDFIAVIIKEILMPIGGVVAVLMIMWAGFLYVTAGGNETQIKKAHEALTWAVIGAAILLGAWVISAAIQGTINELSKP